MPPRHDAAALEADDLSDQAIDWIVRLHSGAATDQDHAAWAAWRDLSPAHAVAAEDAERLWLGIGSAGTAWGQTTRRRRLSRRAVLGGGVAVAVAGGLNQLGVLGRHLLADHQTARAERRAVRLQDGTDVLLNARTALSGQFDKNRREVHLLRGQAFFDIRQPQDAAFRITDGATMVQCRRAEVDAELCDGRFAVTVLTGEVTLTRANQRVTVTANQRVQVSQAGVASPPEAIDAEASMAWRRGKLIFDRRQLADLATELERYRGGRIVVLGDALAALEVSGVFDLGDPEAVLDTLQMALPVRITRMPMLAVIKSA